MLLPLHSAGCSCICRSRVAALLHIAHNSPTRLRVASLHVSAAVMLSRLVILSLCANALVPAVPPRKRLAPRHAIAEPDLAALFSETPCFALADADGQLALLDDGKNKAIEFYIDAAVAVKRKQYWDVDGDKLTVKPLSLGKALAAYGDDETAARFVASPDELNEARRIFVRCSGGDVPESLEELLATYEELDPRKSFATPLDVPLFCIDALRLSPTEPAPWYFSSKDLLETWETASGKSREEAYDSISMMNLREMVRGCVESIRESVTGVTSRRWRGAAEI